MALALPIHQGKHDHMYDHIEESLGETFHDLVKGHGLTVARVYHQTAPSEAMIIYLEGPNLQKTLEGLAADPKTKGFWDMISNLGGHGKEEVGTTFSTMVFDWHHEEGHRHQPTRPAKK
jgi:hypothetical protein